MAVDVSSDPAALQPANTLGMGSEATLSSFFDGANLEVKGFIPADQTDSQDERTSEAPANGAGSAGADESVPDWDQSQAANPVAKSHLTAGSLFLGLSAILKNLAARV